MTEDMTRENPAVQAGGEEVAPDALLSKFQGHGVMKIALFAVAVHAVVLVGTSIPFLWRTVFGEGVRALPEEQRTGLAVEDATAYIRKIAEKYDLTSQQISDNFGKGATRAPAVKSVKKPAQSVHPAVPKEDGGSDEPPKTGMEKELDVKVDGPAVPDMEEDDLFKTAS